MCGISFIYDPTRQTTIVDRLDRMHACIRHRGPDGEGFLFLNDRGEVRRQNQLEAGRRQEGTEIAVGFRRLKICDLSPAADQPMASADGRIWLAFNGEIYNFRELRRRLEAKGLVFRTHGDTEVVVAAYEAWGVDCFAELEGMWAIVLIDLAEQKIVASRDRFGIKPLYWTIDGGSLYLASEIKQILAARQQSPAPNRPLIEMYLRGTRYPCLEETFFEGIQAIPPASWMEQRLGSAIETPSFRSYWNLSAFAANGNAPLYAEALERTDQLLSEAVESHAVADVRVGALMSGGLDSSTLIALLRQNDPDRDLPTFSLGYRQAAPAFCEMRFVDVMAQRDAIENHEISLDAEWVLSNLDRVLWHLEEPPMAMPAVAQYRVFELCAQHGITVVIDGQGSDEITAGYHYHQRAFLKECLIERNMASFFSELLAIARKEHRFPSSIVSEHFIAPRLRQAARQDWVGEGGPRANRSEWDGALGDRSADASLLNQQLYSDVRWGNVKIVLGYGDRNAMAHSVESRVPFFDRRFVEHLFTLPSSYKIGQGDRKHILRDVARRRGVPTEITERVDRMGFGTPDEEMIRGPMWSDIEATIHDESFLASPAVNRHGVLRLLLDFRRGLTHDYRALWRLYALERWARRFNVEL